MLENFEILESFLAYVLGEQFSISKRGSILESSIQFLQYTHSKLWWMFPADSLGKYSTDCLSFSSK